MPAMDDETRAGLVAGWDMAMKRTLWIDDYLCALDLPSSPSCAPARAMAKRSTCHVVPLAEEVGSRRNWPEQAKRRPHRRNDNIIPVADCRHGADPDN